MAYGYFDKYLRPLFVAVFLLIANGAVFAQDTTALKAPVPAGNGLSGVVVDEYGVPLRNVSVSFKRRPDTTSTDINGRFYVSAVNNDVLIFRYPNFYVREVKVSRTDSLVVRLLSSYLKAPKRIDVLYGTANPANNLGSVASIYTSQLTTTPSTLYTYALPGQLAGLYTQQVSGFAAPQTGGQTTGTFIGPVVQHNNYSANDNTEIALTLRGQTPITVIDNVQRELSSIDPESIESVSVLKDALSNILLGNNSSRGVLLVTTKKPEIGKPRISFTAQTALQKPLGLPNPLPAYQYAYLYNEALQNDGRQPIYTSTDFNAYRNQTDPLRHPDINWFNTLLRNSSPLTSYRLNVNGGSNIARYTISLNYLDQAGMFKNDPNATYNTNTGLNRYMLNSNVSVNVTPKFIVELQLFGRVQQFNQPGAGYPNLLNTLFTTPNNAYPLYNPNGSFGGTTLFTNNLLSQSQFSGYQRTNSNDVLANLDLKYDLSSVTPGLSVQGKGNVSFSSQSLLNRSLQNNAFLLSGESSYSSVGSSSSQINAFSSVSSARYSYAQGTVNYDRSFGRNNFTGLLLYDYRSVVLNYDLSQVTTNRAVKLGYNYDGKYFIEGALNNSGYNRYPPGHQFGMFYAFGLGWQMAQESFIKDNFSWINSWKWRATYGKTGNANVDNYGYYNYRQTYSQVGGYPYSGGTSYANLLGYQEDPLANPNISWENANKLDVGVDIALFNSHFGITADYYRDRYYDLLQVRGNSIALLGTPYTAENIGVNRYEGGEVTLKYQNHINNFNYFISANGSLMASKIVFSDEVATPYPWLRRTGRSLGTLYGYQALGFFQTAQEAATSPTTVGYSAKAGDVKYADLNGDGIINQFDIKPIGNQRPLAYYGGTIGFNYKGFSISAIVQGVANRQIYYNNVTTNGFAGIGFLGLIPNGQGYDQLNGRWTPETAATATLPRLSLNNANNSAGSSLYVRSGNYFRLKNAEIGYNLPYQWVQHLHISGIRVFANGENLVTFYGYKGVDPEVYGIAYPIQRVFNAGINVKL